MKRFLLSLSILSITLLLFGSCILDPKKEPPPKDGGGGGEYKSLKEKDDVLYNFALAYNTRGSSAVTEYKKLTDEDESVFIFVFSPEDFAQGKTPKQWGRTKELAVTERMFQRGGSDPIQSMTMKFSYAQGDIAWEAATPPAGHEQENWFQKFVTYDLTVQTVGGQNLYAIDSQALFLIRYRFNSVAQDTVWQVVQYYDLGPLQ